jgi:hypothetical protein
VINAIEFCARYIEWLEEIDHVINEAYYPAIRRMYITAPQDLISPVACFYNDEHAIGFIWNTLVKTHKGMQKESQHAATA